ncbi:MAG: amino acid adenylation domain-containing protein [Motiliproteus sp.]
MVNSRNIESVYGLTSLQEGILYHSLGSEDPGVYLGQYSATLLGDLNAEMLRDAWDQVVIRHGALRSLFAWRHQEQRPLQIVRERIALPWQFEDWSDDNPKGHHHQWQQRFEQQRAQGFELDKAPLFRLVLVRLASQQHRLLFSYHHLLFDGWSLRLLLDEVAQIYTASTNRILPSLEPAGRFEDYVNWLDSRDWQQAEQYWSSVLGDVEAPTMLNLSRPKPQSVSQQERSPFGFRALARELDPEILMDVEQFSRLQRVTLNTVFSAAWSLLLARYADTDDVLFGSAQAGRPAQLPGAAQTVGLFINTIAVRTRIEPESRVADWMRALQLQQLRAQEHQHLPLAQAQRLSKVAPGQRLFETLLVYQGVPTSNGQGASESSASDQGESDQRPSWRVVDESFLEYGNYPLALLVRPGTPFIVTAVYDIERFDSAAVERLLRHFEQLLVALIKQPESTLCSIELLSEDERHLLLQNWSGAIEAVKPSGRFDSLPLPEWIEQAGQQTPHAIALEQGSERVNYSDLLHSACRLADVMRLRGMNRGGYGAVFLERSPVAMIAMLAVLKSGAAYVPLDPAYPSLRIQSVLKELADAARQQERGALIVTSRALAERLPHHELQVVLVDELSSRQQPPSPALVLNTGSTNLVPDSIAYVMYTSGSTGRPKGVMVSHANLSASIAARSHHYPEPPRRFLLLSSLASDSSIAGLFWTLSAGGTLILPKAQQQQSLVEIAAIIREQRVTHLLCLPSLYALLLERAVNEDLHSLRCVIVAGEPCHSSVVAAHHRQLPETQLFNEYGPSEASVWSTHARLGSDLAGIDRVPIGRPIKGWRVYVLDQQRRTLPPGLPGELYIGGPGISQGYLASPELTAARFVPDPFIADKSQRLYRTGDLVRFLDDGQLNFLGRIDNQIKVRGYRVEPEEIEQALLQLPAIQEAAVVLEVSSLKPDNDRGQPQQSRLVAYLGVTAEALSTAQVRNHLRERVPEHMIPHTVVILETLPRTTGGKIDLSALRAMAEMQSFSSGLSTSGYAAACNETEQMLVDIWQRVLNRSRVGIHDNFFEIGGDSLLSIRILARVHRSGYEISPVEFFARPTVAEQAQVAQAIDTAIASAVTKEKIATEAATSAADSITADSTSADSTLAHSREPFALAQLDAASLGAIMQQLSKVDGKGESS